MEETSSGVKLLVSPLNSTYKYKIRSEYNVAAWKYARMISISYTHLNNRLSTLVNDLEGPVLHVRLNLRVSETATDETLGIEDGVDGIHGDLVLSGVTDETFSVGEGDI